MTAVDKILKIEEELNSFLLEREDHIHCLLLGVAGGFNTLFLGTPGTAKSMIVRELTKRITGCIYFEQLLHRFGAPEELFGPYSSEGLKNDKYYRITKGKASEANIIFLDEVFKSNPSNLNTMLALMNEHIFHNAGTVEPTPTISVIGASNELPSEDDGLEALFDRFHFKVKTESIQDPSNFKKLLHITIPTIVNQITFNDLNKLKRERAKIELNDGMEDLLATLRQSIRKNGIRVTDRTWKIGSEILKTEALMKDRGSVNEEDFEIFQFVLWSDPTEIRKVQRLILELTNPEREEILALYEAVINTGKKVLDMDGAKDRMNAAVEACAEMKTAKDKMHKKIEAMKKKKKDTRQVRDLEQKCDDTIRKVFKECVGCNLDDLAPTTNME